MEAGELDQVHRLSGGANLGLDVGRVSDLNVFKLRTSFDNIYQIVDAWQEASTTNAVAISNLEIKERKAEVEKRLAKIAAKEIERTGVVTRVAAAINKKKAKITEVAEQIAALQEQMSQLNRECNDHEGISATYHHILNNIQGRRDSLQAHQQAQT